MEIQFKNAVLIQTIVLCRLTLSLDGIRKIIKSYRELNSGFILRACLKDSNKICPAESAVTALAFSCKRDKVVMVPLSHLITQLYIPQLSHLPTVFSSHFLKRLKPASPNRLPILSTRVTSLLPDPLEDVVMMLSGLKWE